jgi:serine/threonine protein kinase
MTDPGPNPPSKTVKTADEFLGLVRASGLVETTRLGAVEAAVAAWRTAAGPMPDACRKALVDGDLLTEWQIGKLLGGQSKGFFLGDCKLLKPLGQGGMGSVYLAEHKEEIDDEIVITKVALKVLPKNVVSASGASLERFQQENWAASQLRHPKIARARFDFREAAEDSRYHYFIMEYIEGTDLDKTVRQKGPLSPREAAGFIQQAAEGLHYAHEEGVVHRDIKPANLIIEPRGGHLKILDMGLVQLDSDDDTTKSLAEQEHKKSLGTPDYMAPEQARGKPADRRSDVYSLGCTLYFLLTGHPPFESVTGTSGGASTRVARMRAHLDKEPPDPRRTRPDLPAEIVAMLMKMMEKDPNARVQTAGEVAKWFEAWRAGGRPPLPASPLRPAVAAAGPLPAAAGRSSGIQPSIAAGGSGVAPATQHPNPGGSHVARQSDTPAPSSPARSTGRMPPATSAGSSVTARPSASGRGSAARSGSTGRSAVAPVAGKRPVGAAAPAAGTTGRRTPPQPPRPQPATGLPLAIWVVGGCAIAAILIAVIWLIAR